MFVEDNLSKPSLNEINLNANGRETEKNTKLLNLPLYYHKDQ